MANKVFLPRARSDPRQVLSLQFRSTSRVFDHALDSPPHESPRLTPSRSGRCCTAGAARCGGRRMPADQPGRCWPGHGRPSDYLRAREAGWLVAALSALRSSGAALSHRPPAVSSPSAGTAVTGTAGRGAGWLRRVGLATAVVMAVTSVPVAATGAASVAAAAAAGAGVPGAVAMGGGASGSVHEQTGAFQTALPLVSLPGRGGMGVGLALVYDQDGAGAGGDRHGLGAGMGLGKPFITPGDGGTLHTASGGGSYPIRPGDTEGTGLGRYLLKDLALRDTPGVLPGREGLEDLPREYRWVLTYDDGRKNFFSAQGDLIAEQDVFGNETAYEWELHAEQHRLAKAVDAWGQAVTFGYSTPGEVTVTSPVRSDGERPRVVLRLDEGRLSSVTYPGDQVTRLAWDHTPEGMPGRLLTRIEAPVGAVTRVSYDSPHGFPVASSLKVTDREGRSLTPERTFRLGSEGEHAGNDFAGRGRYDSADALFDSADADYRYVTELSDGYSTVRSVYNSLHLLKERTATLHVNGETAPVRTQELTYEGEREDGQVPPPASGLPANYGKPVKAEVTVYDPATGQSRTTAETARFDEHGRETERTDVTGATTVTEYDPTALDTPAGQDGGTGGGTDSDGDSGAQGGPAGYGLPVKVTVTGADGTQTVTENTLSAGRKSIARTTQSVKNAGEKESSARTVAAFSTNAHGELTGKSVTWAAGAKPDGVEGPDELKETYESAADTRSRTRTTTVTSEAGTVSEVTDLVTGHVIRVTGTDGRTTETGYDEAGRPVTQTVPGGPDGRGLTVTAAYTPLTTTVTAPGQDGKKHVTVEHRDLLGRVVKQTDNISRGQLTEDPAARTLQTVAFTDGGRTAEVTDTAGRTTVTTSDTLGRPVKTTAPNGLTQLTVYADAATADTSTVTTLTLPAGETDPAKAIATATGTLDNAGRPVTADSSFADGTQQTGSTTAYDGLGRTARAVSGDVAVTPSYGPAGTPAVTTLTPQNTGTFPGPAVTAASTADLTGAPVVKTLTAGQNPDGEEADGGGRSGRTLVRDAAGRLLEERRPGGSKTTFAYTHDGRVKETVSPGGIRTAYTYDKDTGQVTETAVTSADGTATERTAYTYDKDTGAVTAVFSPDDEEGTRISYTYDADGHVTETAYPDGKTVHQKYGDDGRLEKTTDVAGLTTFYTYNPDGTVAEAVQHERDDQNSPVEARVAYTYDGLGRIIKTGRGNGVVTETEFTGAHQIRHEKTTRDGKVLTEAAYTYDSHNNLTQRTDTRPEAGADGAPGEAVTTTTRYTYDAYNRLTGSEVLDDGGKPLTTTRYTLNVSGDVVKTETTAHTGDQAGKTTVTENTLDPSGRLTARTTASGSGSSPGPEEQVFDTDGNLTTSHDGTRWTYNLNGQPATMTAPDGTTVRYTYWADGTRATTTHTPASSGGETTSTAGRGQTARFYYTPDGTILNDTHTTSGGADTEATPSAAAAGLQESTASYLLAGARHARTLTGPGAEEASATGAGYLLADRHGSTTALTTSGDGEASQAWQYTDYGQPASPGSTPLPPAAAGPAGAARQPFTFAGEYTDPHGTQYLKTRLYDTVTGRFTTPDPAPRHNRYQGMGANPVNRVDPEGTTEIPDWGSWLIWGVTTAAALITLAATALTPVSIGTFIALGGAVLDVASGVLDAVALGTGRNQLEDPLNIAAITLGAAGLLAGGIGGALHPSTGFKPRTAPPGESLPAVPPAVPPGESLPAVSPAEAQGLLDAAAVAGFPNIGVKRGKGGHLKYDLGNQLLSPDEAQWASSQNIAAKTQFHGTRAAWGRAIEKEGFKMMKATQGRNFGDGIYTTPIKEKAIEYRGSIYNGALVSARLNLPGGGNILKFRPASAADGTIVTYISKKRPDLDVTTAYTMEMNNSEPDGSKFVNAMFYNRKAAAVYYGPFKYLVTPDPQHLQILDVEYNAGLLGKDLT
ncbi:RHS repeat-associated core domain-containing protein [Streptomyces sp. NPDC096030]|uniref:RHS repeat domain-containing protein n=1 Tax=Streptomyces sp. NPDC096030 TaxID=3155423 RepID=UPI00331EC423